MDWKSQTAYSLLINEFTQSDKSCIQVHCELFDLLLGLPGIFGINRKVITEIVGLNGSGKTQLCLQLCFSAIMDKGKAIYLDTKGGFCMQRFVEIFTERFKMNHQKLTNVELTKFLANLIFSRITRIEDLITIVEKNLEILVCNNSSIKLIVLDSFPFLIKASGKESRTHVMYRILNNLQKLAFKYNLAVVVTNDLTTKFPKPGCPTVVPALGQTFSHQVGQRIFLFYDIERKKHLANLEKSLHKPCRTVEFAITSRGIE